MRINFALFCAGGLILVGSAARGGTEVAPAGVSNLLHSVTIVGFDGVRRMPTGTKEEPLGAVFERLRVRAVEEDERCAAIDVYLDSRIAGLVMQTSESTPSNVIRTCLFNVSVSGALDLVCQQFSLDWQVCGNTILVRKEASVGGSTEDLVQSGKEARGKGQVWIEGSQKTRMEDR